MEPCSKPIQEFTSPFDCLLFDLDDTLYSSKVGIGEACKRNIEEFLVKKCGFAEVKASGLRVELFKTYGSSLAGLRFLGYDIDADDYHGFVHGRLPYEAIKPDPQLRALLRSINQRKIIFTNSDRKHAIKVLERIGLQDCFDEIICFETLNPNISKSSRPNEFPVVLKPSIDAMKIAIDAAQVDPRRTLFLDDNERNIAAGKSVGLRTVLVGKQVKRKEGDYVVESVVHLPQVVPEIWVSPTDSKDQRMSRGRSEMDPVLKSTTVGA
ncbi:PREDICTED: uncharacterized protein LOC104611920 [Nelumbo nucifera]|uniref:Uncharacterized protein LOC104611920 n=1 Tax=Nelumbo nucifera TaxID=4432 RepID=A0A1U8BKV3_NELNU|nr:PREDICTED: uncharacterized protein LOC104611920 [Nelumbo nucifera]